MSDELELEADQVEGEPESAAPPAPISPASIPTRFSLLKRFSLSAAHYWESCQAPQDDTIATKLGQLGSAKGSDALRFGTCVHELLLGDEGRIAVWVGGRRAGKAFDACKLEAAERGATCICNPAEIERARSIATSVRRHPLAWKLIADPGKNGKPRTVIEQRIDWTFAGKATRSTPDAYKPGKRGWIVDLKSSITSQPGAFDRLSSRLFYHVQAWLYAEAIEQTTGKRPKTSHLVVVEKTKPFPVTVYTFGPRILAAGERLARTWIEQLTICEIVNQWPTYAAGAVPLELPELETYAGITFGGRSL